MKTIVCVSACGFFAGCASAPDSTQPTAAVRKTDLPATYAPLFDGTSMRFDWSYEVDTHDPEHPLATLKGKVTCKTTLTTMVEARLADVECELVAREGELAIGPALAAVWIATADGLWLAGEVPADPAALAEVLKEAPYLLAAPVPYVKEHPGDLDPFGEKSSSTTTVFQDGELWCRSDESPEFYGTVGRTLCFGPGRGVVKVEMIGRNGPSSETYIRR